MLEEFDESVRSRIVVVLEPVFGNNGICAVDVMSEKEISDFMTETYGIARNIGYGCSSSDISVKPRRSTYCYAERTGEWAISPEGLVFKCTVQDFLPEDAVGKLNADGSISYNGRYSEWMAMGERFAEICKSCVFLPVCMGGCRVTMQKPLLGGKVTCRNQQVQRSRFEQMVKNLGHRLI